MSPIDKEVVLLTGNFSCSVNYIFWWVAVWFPVLRALCPRDLFQENLGKPSQNFGSWVLLSCLLPSRGTVFFATPGVSISDNIC